MPYILVIYDISRDDSREAYRRALTAAGYEMIQKSAYLRKGAAGSARHAARLAARYADPSTDSVIVLTLPQRVWETRLGHGARGHAVQAVFI